jgi:hypothetical protein
MNQKVSKTKESGRGRKKVVSYLLTTMLSLVIGMLSGIGA